MQQQLPNRFTPMPIAVDSNLIGRILAPALRLWLRSQVDGVETLDIAIDGKDRQILRGYVPRVELTSHQAIYQGLQLGRVLLKGENIRINIGQVIKGKPLQLLEPIRVSGEVQLSQSHLQASLTSGLLANAFTELLIALLEQQGIYDPKAALAPYQFQWQAIALEHRAFRLQGQVTDPAGHSTDLTLSAALKLVDAKRLHLEEIVLTGLPVINHQTLGRLVVDLGDDVDIEALHLSDGELSCLGRLLIRP
ncbi:MAG: DUF2993 domain-containing protein [Synechocystis sp.]|nr:DUF2993 domain-containing protein [Synechocystis sp.]